MYTYDGKIIQKILKKWKCESGAKRVIQFRYRNGILSIFTSEPGYMIGKAGCLVYKYEDILRKEFSDFIKVEFTETENYWAQSLKI